MFNVSMSYALITGYRAVTMHIMCGVPATSDNIQEYYYVIRFIPNCSCRPFTGSPVDVVALRLTAEIVARR